MSRVPVRPADLLQRAFVFLSLGGAVYGGYIIKQGFDVRAEQRAKAAQTLEGQAQPAPAPTPAAGLPAPARRA